MQGKNIYMQGKNIYMQERKYIYAREIYICKKENIYMQGKYIYARNFFIQAFSIVRIWSVFYFYIINKKTCETKSSKRNKDIINKYN